MIAITIKNPKNFMNQLLLSDTFDRFQVSEVQITTFATFSIDGKLHHNFYGPEDSKERKENGQTQILWGNIRNYCFSLIKGKRTPLSFKIILMLPKDETETLLTENNTGITSDDIYGLYLNCQFNGETLTLTTGTSLRIFTLEKSLEHAWDQKLQTLLNQQAIDYLLP